MGGNAAPRNVGEGILYGVACLGGPVTVAAVAVLINDDVESKQRWARASDLEREEAAAAHDRWENSCMKQALDNYSAGLCNQMVSSAVNNQSDISGAADMIDTRKSTMLKR